MGIQVPELMLDSLLTRETRSFEGSGPDDPAADRRLARRIVDGDEEAFDLLVSEQYGQVSRIVGRFFRHPHILDDIVQDVFVKVFLNMRSYRGQVPIQHWVSRITVNTCYDRLRKDRRQREIVVSQIAECPEQFFDSLRAPDSSESNAFWNRDETRVYAEQLLDMLSAPERLVLTLMVLEGLSVAEVASVTGWSKANVKIRAFRARNRLKKILVNAELDAKET